MLMIADKGGRWGRPNADSPQMKKTNLFWPKALKGNRASFAQGKTQPKATDFLLFINCSDGSRKIHNLNFEQQKIPQLKR